MTSHSPLLSMRRSPIRSSIGKTRRVASCARLRFFSGRGLAIRAILRAPAPRPHGLTFGVKTPVNLARVRGRLGTGEATMDQESLRLLIQRKIRDGRLPHDGIKKVW